MLKRQEGDRIWTKPTNGSKATSQKPEKQPLNNGMYSCLMPRKKHKKHIDARESSFTCNSSKQRETLWFLFLWFIVRQFVPKPDALSWTFEVKWNPSDTFSCHTSLSAWRRAAGSSCDEELAQRHRLVITISLSQLSCFLFNLSLTRSPTGHTCVTLQRRAISTSPQDDVAWLNCNKVVNWQRPRHAAAGGGRWAFCVLPGAVTDIQPDNFPPQLPEFFNICIYSCLPRVWCTVLFHVALECYFTFKVSLSYILQSVIVVK